MAWVRAEMVNVGMLKSIFRQFHSEVRLLAWICLVVFGQGVAASGNAPDKKNSKTFDGGKAHSVFTESGILTAILDMGHVYLFLDDRQLVIYDREKLFLGTPIPEKVRLLDSEVYLRYENNQVVIQIETFDRSDTKKFNFLSETIYYSLVQRRILGKISKPYRTESCLCRMKSGATTLVNISGFMDEHRKAGQLLIEIYDPVSKKSTEISPKQPDVEKQLQIESIYRNNTLTCRDSNLYWKAPESIFEQEKSLPTLKVWNKSIKMNYHTGFLTSDVKIVEIGSDKFYRAIFTASDSMPKKNFGMRLSMVRPILDKQSKLLYYALSLRMSTASDISRRHFITGTVLLDESGDNVHFFEKESLLDIHDSCILLKPLFRKEYRKVCM
ncbi:MAG: hypothetical protein LC109_01875 [Bacteroidia bacterium]|nr:hypothetical protein [Bacteroidia bacterium]